MHSFPTIGNRRIGEYRANVVLFVSAHRPARLVFGDLDSVSCEQLYKGRNRPSATEIQRGPGDIENDGANGRVPVRSRMHKQN